MPCTPEMLKNVPLFALLDDEEAAVLAAQVERREFAPHQRIYKIGDPGERAYFLVSGSVRVTIFDNDHQEVLIDQPSAGEFFGFASMMDQTPHQTQAEAVEPTVCIEIDRTDTQPLLQNQKPHAGIDMLTVLWPSRCTLAQQLVRGRATRNPNEVIEEESYVRRKACRPGGRVSADHGRSSFRLASCWSSIRPSTWIYGEVPAWDPYPFILLNLFDLYARRPFRLP